MQLLIRTSLFIVLMIFSGCTIKVDRQARSSLKLSNNSEAVGCRYVSSGRVDNLYGFGDSNFRTNVHNKMLNKVVQRGGNAYVVHQAGVYNADFSIYKCPKGYNPKISQMIAMNEALSKYKTSQSIVNYNTEIQNLLTQYPAAKIDKKKWLFIISIENYSDTDNVYKTLSVSE